MSLLLDALDRADKERGQQSIRPSSPVAPPISAAKEVRIKRWVLEAVIGLLFLSLVVYALFFRSSSEVSDSVVATNPIEASPMSASPIPEALPIQETQITGTRQQKVAPIVAARNVLTGENVSSASIPDTSVSKLYQQQDNRDTVIEKEIASSSPISTPTLSNSPEQTQANEGSPNSPTVAASTDNGSREIYFQQVPMLSDMPTQFKRRVPSLKYSTHVYSKDSRTGFVNINGPFREVGSQIAQGITLIAILPDGVVLEMDGTLFRLRALNDWVGY